MLCKLSMEQNLQAVNLLALDQASGPRLRDLHDPVRERTSFSKQRAARLLRQAAHFVDASTLGDDQRPGLADDRRASVTQLRERAQQMLQERAQKLRDMERAASHAATHYTEAAWGE